MNPGFLDYQVRAHETAQPYIDACATLEASPAADPDSTMCVDFLQLAYTTLGLAGEAGEFANKVKKVLRDAGGEITPESRAALVKELGGVLWYLSECCTQLEVNFGDVAKLNLQQLKSRAERGKLQGSGDDR